MIFTKLRIQNLFCFADAELDFTFQRAITHSNIQNECINDRKSFYIKRLIILSGANATGKTSLAKVMCAMQNFLHRKQLPSILENAILYKDKEAVIEIEFVAPYNNEPHLHSLTLHLSQQNNPNCLKINKLSYARIYIRKNDSAQSARKALQEVIKNKAIKRNSYYLEYEQQSNPENVAKRVAFEELEFKSINYLYILRTFIKQMQFNPNPFDYDKNDKTILEYILKTFDNSIETVDYTYDSNGIKTGFIVRFFNNDSINLSLQLEVSNKDRLSSGTLNAITLTHFFAVIYQEYKNNSMSYGTFFLDEQMAFVHSDLERNMINLLMQFLPLQAQLIITSHNYDVLDLAYPMHSFVFLAKNKGETEFVLPSKTINKNDRTLLNYVKNDVFNTQPDVSKLDKILMEF